MATSADLRAALDEIREGLVLPEREREQLAEKLDGEYQQRALERLYRRIGAMPWWVISGGLHVVIFLLVGLLALAAPATVKPEETLIVADVRRQPPPEFIERRQPVAPPADKTSPEEMPTHLPMPVDRSDPLTSDPTDIDASVLRGDPTGHAAIDESSPMSGVMGVGQIGETGGPSCAFGMRGDKGAKGKLMRRFGGEGTDTVVEAALRWLARHQEPDGHWDCKKYEGSEGANGDMGDTGLALLAFEGAGYTEKSGQFAEAVKRAEEWLMRQQREDGRLGSGNGYAHAIAGLALAEAFGMGGDPRVGEAAQKAVDYSIRVHQVPYSGWRYNAKQAADLSVTGWFVMQLKSARIAGLKVDGLGLQGASAFLDSVSDESGRAGYTSKPKGACPSTTAIGMVCRQFMGTRNTDPLVAGAGDSILKALPKWGGSGWNNDLYYVYYGTLGMFQLGGEKWLQWNEHVKPLLVDNQCKGPLPVSSAPADRDGSWDPYGSGGKRGGRVFMTAMGALSLEVYYRYLPMYAK